MFELIADPVFWASLAILVGLELALGIDNVLFVSAIAAKIPEERRASVRRLGLALAAAFRIALVLGIVWIIGLDRTAISIGGWMPSWRDLVLMIGGIFLIYKAVSELHELQASTAAEDAVPHFAGTRMAIVHIAVASAVFSVDSVFTAVGVTRSVEAMIVAVLITVPLMYLATGPVSAFMARHRSVRSVALGILLLVGGFMVVEGLAIEIAREGLYLAIAVAVVVLLVSRLGALAGDRRLGSFAVPREEPKLGELSMSSKSPVTPHSEQSEDEPEVVSEYTEETLTQAPDDEALEVEVLPVPMSSPKPRRVRKKASRKPKAAPQG